MKIIWSPLAIDRASEIAEYIAQYFVPELRALGYDFVTISELLTHGPAVSSKDCYELMPGDNLRYDRTIGVKPSYNR